MEIYLDEATDYYIDTPTGKVKDCREHQGEKPAKAVNRAGKWSEIPYPGDIRPPKGLDPYAGSWPTFFLGRDEYGLFTAPDGVPISYEIRNPYTINFDESLLLVKYIQKHLTPELLKIAEYWGEGPATKQWTPIIDTYELTPTQAGRVLAAVQAGINDAFVVTWYLKYLLDIPRPIQLDRRLATAICTPYFPSYPSGHSVISGTAEVILSYFFPPEAERLRELAEEASISRLYGGVHFIEDLEEGLRLGRQIGRIIVCELSRQRDITGRMIDIPPVNDRNAVLPPPPYRQAIPFPSRVRDCDLPLLPKI